MIYLTPIAGKEPKGSIRTFGFTYAHRDGVMRVSSIYAGSQAEKAGLQIDTSILSINRKAVHKLSEEEIRRFKNGVLIFSSEEDQEIAIEILVDGKKSL